ncbi:MAG: GDSL-like Lipase/Acylhydrolase [Spirochaetes bacterium ADurb.Bin110]|jgi:lysophospholipase L1-like esterase|nr:MAG: GDSL-like Lipase/Acylhydrolase [Spirochaetes bacterium ADurb.Bin110]
MLVREACVFGDSIARGVILDDQGSYKPLKDCFASLAAEELGVALINKARFGCTIAKGREIIERTLDRFLGKSKEPVFDYVFLEFGGNDCDFRWDEISVRPHAQHLPATPPELFVKHYSEVIEELRARGLKPILLTLPPLVAERYFAWFTRTGLDQEAILMWLGDVEFIYRWHESYSCLVWEIGEKYDAPVIDIRKSFLEQRNYQRFLCKDGIHPNVEGHSLIKAEIVAFARQHLVES